MSKRIRDKRKITTRSQKALKALRKGKMNKELKDAFEVIEASFKVLTDAILAFCECIRDCHLEEENEYC